MRPALHFLAVALLAAACQPAAAPAGLTDTDKAAIDSLDKEFARLANTGDFGALVRAYYVEDAMMLPPNAPAVTGQAAIEAVLRTFPPISDFQLNTEEIDGLGDLAYARGRYSMTLTPAGGAPMTDSGKYLEIWRKRDGAWRVTRDMFSSDIPLPAPEPPKP